MNIAAKQKPGVQHAALPLAQLPKPPTEGGMAGTHDPNYQVMPFLFILTIS